MTHAELLRKHATDATNEGGMWFSGEYLSRIAETAESLEDENAKLRDENQSIGMVAYELGRNSMADENAKLRELVDYMTPIALYAASERERDRMHELGVEVDA